MKKKDLLKSQQKAPQAAVLRPNQQFAAKPPIDFAAEKAAMQELYSAFYIGFNDNDMNAIEATFRTSDNKVAFGTIFAGNETCANRLRLEEC